MGRGRERLAMTAEDVVDISHRMGAAGYTPARVDSQGFAWRHRDHAGVLFELDRRRSTWWKRRVGEIRREMIDRPPGL